MSRITGRAIATLALLAALLCALVLDARYPTAFRQPVFDTYQRLIPRRVERYPAIIIDVDDESLAEFGQWPWPRTLTARLVAQVAALGPLSIGFDIIMPEPDRLSPAQIIGLHPGVDDAVRRSVQTLESNDLILGRAIAKFPVVVARAGLHDVPPDEGPIRRTPVMIEGGGGIESLLTFDALLLNVEHLEKGATGVGLVNTRRDSDGVVRRVPLVMGYDDGAHPSLALELLRVATGANWLTVKTDGSRVRGVQIGDSFVPSDDDGQLTVYFSAPDAERRISAARVLRGEVEQGALAGQVALIGVTALGLTDVVATPVSRRMDGVEVHAQVIENILSGQRLVRPANASIFELVSALVAGLVLVWALPRCSALAGAGLVVGFAVLAVALCFGLFHSFKELYSPVAFLMAISSSYFVLLALMLTEANRQRRLLGAALEEQRLAGARIAGELGAARDIQLGMLPDPCAIAGLPESIRLHARLESAFEVGGDLYDVYMVDERRLFFMVGDVSGKGVPASLFMAISKALCKQVTLHSNASMGVATSRLNEALSNENPAQLFVTAVAAVLDVRTGEGQLCIAGHDAPLIVKPGGAVRSVDSVGGPPLCALDQFDYPSECFQMSPGEIIVLWTDGVGEAVNEEAAPSDGHTQYYGRQGVVQFLESLPTEISPEELVNALFGDVTAFAAKGLSDDVTVVAVEFIGDGKIG